ncbi:Uncharacterised protein [Enterobacter cloacae]|nr:Uncharacterised protein [Enterobacter cloacae]
MLCSLNGVIRAATQSRGTVSNRRWAVLSYSACTDVSVERFTSPAGTCAGGSPARSKSAPEINQAPSRCVTGTTRPVS